MKCCIKAIPVIIFVFFTFSCGHKSGRRNTRSETIPVSSNHRSSQGPAEINPVSADKLPLNKLFMKYQASVFLVLTTDGEQVFLGTGFFVSKDGVAVSNYHVFKGTTLGREVIKTVDGEEYKLERVLAHDEDGDFIVFKVNLHNQIKFTPIPIAPDSPDIGEDVFAIGNPHGLEHTLSRGIVSGYRFEGKLIQTTAEITHGSSGGPLMNMKGEVVGITTSGVGEANLNFAVNIHTLPLSEYISQSSELPSSMF